MGGRGTFERGHGRRVPGSGRDKKTELAEEGGAARELREVSRGAPWHGADADGSALSRASMCGVV